MSDEPVVRRSKAVKALLRNIRESGVGWTVDECIIFLVREYGYGIRRRTAADIIRELTELGVLHTQGLKKYVREP